MHHGHLSLFVSSIGGVIRKRAVVSHLPVLCLGGWNLMDHCPTSADVGFGPQVCGVEFFDRNKGITCIDKPGNIRLGHQSHYVI